MLPAMRRTRLAFLRTTGLLLAPVIFSTACPGDDTSVTSADDSSSTNDDNDDNDDDDDTTTSTPTTGMPTTETMDPDSSSTDPTDPTTTTDPTDPTTTTEPEESSSTDPTDPTTTTGDLCGNGAIDDGEECDGDDLGDETCVSQDFDEGTLACADDCSFDTTACVMFSCGNNAIEGKEICDGTDLGGADCVSEGFPLGGELGCADNCGDYDVSACLSPICGNGVIEGDEICDGGDLAGESCQSQGFVGGELLCFDDCSGLDTGGCTLCGNGIIDPGEGCDGNALGNQDCFTAGYDGGTLSCAASCQIDASACTEITTTQFCVQPAGAILDNQTLLSQIPVAGLSGTVTDINVSVEATHTWVADMTAITTHLDTANAVTLFQNQCGSTDNVNVDFDDEAGAFACPLTGPTTMQAQGDLNAFASTVGDGNGTYEISINDNANGDTGTLIEWCVNITTEAPVGGGGGVPDGCELVNGQLWCFNAGVCGQACNDVCGDIGLALDIDDGSWFAAQDEPAECQAIADTFGFDGGINLGGYTYACLEDAIDDGEFAGQLFCSNFAGCPFEHRTNADALGVPCGPGAYRSICPCNDPGGGAGQQDFAFTGGEQQFVVPAGVFSVHIAAFGAQGGDATNNVAVCMSTDVPGLGGHAEGDLAVTPGEVLSIFVGGAGGSGNAPGFNGGGGSCPEATTCGSGGGASDVRQAGNALANRVVVAGAGGGAEWSCGPNGGAGAGGGLDGGNGLNGDTPTADGLGGTQFAGGAGGPGDPGDGTNGALGQGGAAEADSIHGGGGGGGYFGGGGGGTDGHGGGGSSYLGGVSNGVTNAGVQSGNGSVSISWGN